MAVNVEADPFVIVTIRSGRTKAEALDNEATIVTSDPLVIEGIRAAFEVRLGASLRDRLPPEPASK